MAISKFDFCSFITELVTRNRNLGKPTLEDELFANLLIFNYLYGKGKGKGKGEGLHLGGLRPLKFPTP